MASNEHGSSAWGQPVSSMESPNTISANTSNSSSASEVLRRSSALQGSQSEQHGGKHNSSDASLANSSISSSGSMRVRIKAKYLRERKSPFETGGSSSTPYLPPALPGNLPEGYEAQRDVADVQRHNTIEDVTSAKDGGATAGQVLSPAEGYKQSGFEQLSNAASKNGVGDEFSEITRPSDDHNQSANQRSSSIPPVTHQPMSSSTNMGITHKKTSGILRQGAPTSSSAPCHSSTSGHPRDLRVTHFSKGQRQQAMRDQLLKRSENSKPTKRYYQPKMIASGRPPASKPEETRTAQSDMGTMATATAAAAAAVAATVPLLKTQSDLESKMNHIMEKLSVLEHVGHSAPPPPPWVYPMGQGWGGGGYDARHDLGEMTQRRLGELEELQKQQREMQSELRALSQRNADRGIEVANGMPPHQGTHTFSDHLSSPGDSQTRPKEPKQEIEVVQKKEDGKTRVGQSGTDPKTSSRSPTTKIPLAKMDSSPKPPEKHVRYTPAVTVHRLPQGQVSSGGQQRSVHQGGVREHHGTQTSPLETPAPRRHAPRPHSKEIRSARLSNLGRGLLEEILSSHDEDERTRDLRQQVQTNHLSALNVNSSNSRYVSMCMYGEWCMQRLCTNLFQGIHVKQNPDKSGLVKTRF
ncbi:uncharacterized protein LOC115929765 [Strongylocentrotus purpuratus]|uniref:Uncharacterized protein n=1 Tax=Strongylocentrotus purpuratus TaxID=7668 RepID=A0A7M7PUU2_STRPU|nr:uncharacterized protein LOC115929765 [Strongylocentrotus purpuratus]